MRLDDHPVPLSYFLQHYTETKRIREMNAKDFTDSLLMPELKKKRIREFC